MKRSLKPGDNAQFNESVGLAWEDFSKPDFQRGLDECQIVFNSSCHSQMQGVVEVVRFAMASEAAADWIVRVFEEGFSNDSNRKAYGALRNAVELQKGSPVDAEELHLFLLHLRFMSHDLDSDHTQAVATQKQLISQRLPNRKSAEVWALLQAACVELNSTAGQITQESAERHLGELGAEFKETRELMRALHDLQSARPGGVNHHVSAQPNSALPLSPEAHGHLLPLAQLLQPFFASAVTPQGASMTEALVIMREATEGFYPDRNMSRGWGEVMPSPDMALSTRKITRHCSERIARRAFELAMKRNRKVTAIHKANSFHMTDGLFLECVRHVAKEFPEVKLDDLLVDASTAHLVRNPERFDVAVATNFYGDIISDLASELSGSLGLAGSIMASDSHCCAQAQHGSAPDIAGQDVANPVSMILSVAMLLQWMGEHHDAPLLHEAGSAMEQAVDTVLEDPTKRTADLGGHLGCRAFGEAVAQAITG